MSDLVVMQVEPPAEPRDRMRALARPILVVPHALLVGGPILPLLSLGAAMYRTGALGLLAVTIAYGCFLRDEYPPFGDGPYPAPEVGEPSPQSG